MIPDEFVITRPGVKDIDPILEMVSTSFQDELRITGVYPDRIRNLAKIMVSPAGRFLLYLYRAGGTDVIPYVGRVGNRPVAFVMLTLKKEWGYISTVVVHPDARGRGYARRLLSRVIKDAEGKTRRLVLHVSRSNTIAKNLYTSFGFERFETVLTLVHDNIKGLTEGMKGGAPGVRPAHASERKTVFDLVKGFSSPVHQSVIPPRRPGALAWYIHPRSRCFVYSEEGISGTITCSVPGSPGPVRLHRLGIHPGVKPAERTEILRALIQASLSWASRWKRERCIVNIEEWSGTGEIIQDLRDLGFHDGLTMEGMKRECPPEGI